MTTMENIRVRNEYLNISSHTINENRDLILDREMKLACRGWGNRGLQQRLEEIGISTKLSEEVKKILSKAIDYWEHVESF